MQLTNANDHKLCFAITDLPRKNKVLKQIVKRFNLSQNLPLLSKEHL